MRIKNFISAIILFWAVSIYAQDNSLFESKVYVKNKDSLHYRILYPQNFKKDSVYPLVLFLHGAGERGDDNIKQLTHGSSVFLKDSNRKENPAIVIFPQCPKEDYWASVTVDRSTNPIGLDFNYANGPTKSLGLVMDLLDETIKKGQVKESQVYIVGLSMGGMGTYELLWRKPELFAAAIAICGAGEPESVKNYASTIPIWAFHGAKDNVVEPQRSLQMITSILNYGGFPKFILYEDANHNSWDPAFKEPDLLPWLFSHKKSL